MLELTQGWVADHATTYFKIFQPLVRLEKRGTWLVRGHRRAILGIANSLAETLGLFGEAIKALFESTSAPPVVGIWR